VLADIVRGWIHGLYATDAGHPEVIKAYLGDDLLRTTTVLLPSEPL
jgi:hypothetical protein